MQPPTTNNPLSVVFILPAQDAGCCDLAFVWVRAMSDALRGLGHDASSLLLPSSGATGGVLGRAEEIRAADAVVICSGIVGGCATIDAVAALLPRRLVFLDQTPANTLESVAARCCDYVRADQIPQFDLYLSCAGGDVPDRIESELGAHRARVFYPAVDPEPLRADTGFKDGSFRWDMGYFGDYSPAIRAGLERLFLAPARALPNMRFVLVGRNYPDELDWPQNVERQVMVAPEGLAAFLRGQRFALNLTHEVTRRSGWSPSPCLFFASAAGTPVVSDRCRGLETLFPADGAMVIASSTEEIIRTLVGTPPASREAMAEAARAIVLQKHTVRGRAEEFIQAVAETPLRSSGEAVWHDPADRSHFRA